MYFSLLTIFYVYTSERYYNYINIYNDCFLYSALSLGRATSIFTNIVKKCEESSCTVLGLNALHYKARGTFLAYTNSRPPYCGKYNSTYPN